MYIYYHNPKCSKSRAGLEFLQQKQLNFKIKNYIEEGFSEEELNRILSKLDKNVPECLRRKDPLFKQIEQSLPSHEVKDWIAAIVKDPILMERPILEGPKSARIGRPTEALAEAIL